MNSKFLGKYEIEKIKDEKNKTDGYILRGSRGAEYVLIRFPKNPEILYSVNGKTFFCCSVSGYTNFTDKRGYLEPY
jgi:hypothetical protein